MSGGEEDIWSDQGVAAYNVLAFIWIIPRIILDQGSDIGMQVPVELAKGGGWAGIATRIAANSTREIKSIFFA
jgi:hypothetical protein